MSGWGVVMRPSDTLTRVRLPGEHGAADAVKSFNLELARLSGTALPLRLWDGTELGPDDAGFRIVLTQPWSLRALLVPPTDLSAGEAYVRGDVDLEGDVIAAMGAGAHIAASLGGLTPKLGLVRILLSLPPPPGREPIRRFKARGKLHTIERDREAISFHYDLPQRFYEAFLDRNLVYSCAYFADANEDLESAQIRKLDLICRKLRLAPGVRFLDVGCGWGSLLIHAAANYGVEGLGVTLSTTQAVAAQERIAQAGLSDRLEVRLQDYRSVSESFDAVASVGMFEHVGPQQMVHYFETLHELTRPGGLLLNHGIVLGDPHKVRRERDKSFVSAHVFPDGGLLPAWRALRALEMAEFEILDVEQLRPHYALTLRSWVRRLEAAHDEVVSVTSEADYRVWRAYMGGSALSFEEGSLGVIQMLAQPKGPAATPLPFGREWMLPQLPARR